MNTAEIKIYSCETDGLPEVGRPFIAFSLRHEKHDIYTRCNKESILKKNWDNKEGHISPDGEFYSGEHNWIYPISYETYVYIDEMGLIPESHTVKVAKEQSDASKKLEEIKETLRTLYGEENAKKLESFIRIENNRRSVELFVYSEHLIAPFEYVHDLVGLYDQIAEKYGANFAKEILNIKLISEGANNTDAEAIDVNRDFFLNDVWEHILMSYNAKGIVKNGKLYVAKIFKRGSLNLSEIKNALSARKLLKYSGNDYWLNSWKTVEIPVELQGTKIA